MKTLLMLKKILCGVEFQKEWIIVDFRKKSRYFGNITKGSVDAIKRDVKNEYGFGE